jgi:L,D-transpeptidase YbiS
MQNIESKYIDTKMPLKRKVAILLITSTFTISLFVFLLFSSQKLKEVAISFYTFPDPLGNLAVSDSIQLAKSLNDVQKRIKNLQTKIETLSPRDPYLIINTTNNTFVLRSRKEIIRNGICSTGSYTLLDAGENQQWIFKTPKGQFRILGKLANPLWVKPDWAFIEEGLPVPPKNHPDRYEYGTLGDYALSLGQGYLLHGTLYQRFLGLPVTHGCVRLGDEDLKIIYNSLNIGSRVYIF